MNDTTNTTVIGAGTRIKGDISFETTARILGQVEGRVSSKAEIHVGEGGHCSASLDAARITIDGTVEGDVSASDRIQLNASAVVCGDLTTTSLSVAEGASFVGYCRVGPEAAKLKTTDTVTTTATTTRRENGVKTNGTGPGHETISAAFAGLEAKFAAIGKNKNAEVAATP